jgi:hypothetical protein
MSAMPASPLCTRGSPRLMPTALAAPVPSSSTPSAQPFRARSHWRAAPSEAGDARTRNADVAKIQEDSRADSSGTNTGRGSAPGAGFPNRPCRLRRWTSRSRQQVARLRVHRHRSIAPIHPCERRSEILFADRSPATRARLPARLLISRSRHRHHCRNRPGCAHRKRRRCAGGSDSEHRGWMKMGR